MRSTVILFAITVLSLGCARMQIGGTEKPIKFDISMRLDVYQHVEKDIDAIENIVSGPASAKSADKQGSLLKFFVSEAYAQEGLSPAVEQAALRRKDRLPALSSWEGKGAIGEDRNGFVQARGNNGAVDGIVSAENADRALIYQALAKKNNTPVEEVQKLYARRLQASAPAGTPVESPDGAWRTK